MITTMIACQMPNCSFAVKNDVNIQKHNRSQPGTQSNCFKHRYVQPVDSEWDQKWIFFTSCPRKHSYHYLKQVIEETTSGVKIVPIVQMMNCTKTLGVKSFSYKYRRPDWQHAINCQPQRELIASKQTIQTVGNRSTGKLIQRERPSFSTIKKMKIEPLSRTFVSVLLILLYSVYSTCFMYFNESNTSFLVYGFPSGAISCIGSQVAVDGLHMSAESVVLLPSWEERNIQCSIGGYVYPPNFEETIPLLVGIDYKIFLTQTSYGNPTESFKGFLIRLENLNSNRTSTIRSPFSSLMIENDAQQQFVALCPSPQVVGITHTDASIKTSVVVRLSSQQQIVSILDITLVFEASATLSLYAHGKYKLSFIAPESIEPTETPGLGPTPTPPHTDPKHSTSFEPSLISMISTPPSLHPTMIRHSPEPSQTPTLADVPSNSPDSSMVPSMKPIVEVSLSPIMDPPPTLIPPTVFFPVTLPPYHRQTPLSTPTQQKDITSQPIPDSQNSKSPFVPSRPTSVGLPTIRQPQNRENCNNSNLIYTGMSLKSRKSARSPREFNYDEKKHQINPNERKYMVERSGSKGQSKLLHSLMSKAGNDKMSKTKAIRISSNQSKKSGSWFQRESFKYNKNSTKIFTGPMESNTVAVTNYQYSSSGGMKHGHGERGKPNKFVAAKSSKHMKHGHGEKGKMRMKSDK